MLLAPDVALGAAVAAGRPTSTRPVGTDARLRAADVATVPVTAVTRKLSAAAEGQRKRSTSSSPSAPVVPLPAAASPRTSAPTSLPGEAAASE